ncbi:dihydrolipoyl dehydrogenase [Candidatus Ichthyocystis hellenicum]|uniref:dihydrolipoyl dehydrogenase n=1 Tax=Candidatus Ichthyocystis hellenicum TaxID=1561003 RepID=UPI000A7240E6|nr:dihydrolipoyl dehydrogenase [Candidatus Ichthyocystis hellenicum]
MEKFDVVVIGSGPGGYVAAIRASQRGFKTACVDCWVDQSGAPCYGGTCLNVGCIPSKALLQSSEFYAQAKYDFSDHGVVLGSVQLDLDKMLQRKQKIISDNNRGISHLFKKNSVTTIFGRASFSGKDNDGFYLLSITGHDELVAAGKVIIATGSVPRFLPVSPVDNHLIVDNVGALSFDQVPGRLAIIGAGVIGLEMGSVWSRLGSHVVILEASADFLSAADVDISREAMKHFKKQGIQINLGVHIDSVVTHDSVVTVSVRTNVDEIRSLTFDRLVVAVGRVPNTEGLHLDRVGLSVDSRGFIPVDDNFSTSVPGVYAIGDVVCGPMLAHRATKDALFVVDNMAGMYPYYDRGVIPWVIYTDPEIAWVGKTEEQLRIEGVAYNVGQASYVGSARARAMGRNSGFVKVVSCADTDRILGAHIIGPMASELISEYVVAMSFKSSSQDIASIIHAHPSLSEVSFEAAMAVSGSAIHS